MTTTIRVRAIPYGAALQLTRRALAIGPRVTIAAVHGLMTDWWTLGELTPLDYCPAQDCEHPFTYALAELEITLA